MQFLKTLFWAVLAVLIALFCYNNWVVVPVNLWDGLILETKLPMLLLVAFLVGLLPALLLHGAARWRWRRRLEASERALADERAANAPPVPAAPAQTIAPGAATDMAPLP